MDNSQFAFLRSSIRSSVSSQMVSATPRHCKRKCCLSAYQEGADEATKRTLDVLLEQLNAGNLETLRSSMMASDIIEEQDESEELCEADTTLLDDAAISNIMCDDLNLWKKCDTFKLAEVRHQREQVSLATFNSTMTWLDEILATAKAEFSSSDIVVLPKTPAVKAGRKRKILRMSSPAVDPSTIERPVRRNTRASTRASSRASTRKAKVKLLSATVNKEDEVCTDGQCNTTPMGGLRSTQHRECNDEVESTSVEPKTLRRGATVEAKSVPKKIARFSRLPHVKDKVDAFEKISDGTPLQASKVMAQTSTPTTQSAPQLEDPRTLIKENADRYTLGMGHASSQTLNVTPIVAQKVCTDSHGTPTNDETVAADTPATVAHAGRGRLLNNTLQAESSSLDIVLAGTTLTITRASNPERASSAALGMSPLPPADEPKVTDAIGIDMDIETISGDLVKGSGRSSEKITQKADTTLCTSEELMVDASQEGANPKRNSAKRSKLVDVDGALPVELEKDETTSQCDKMEVEESLDSVFMSPELKQPPKPIGKSTRTKTRSCRQAESTSSQSGAEVSQRTASETAAIADHNEKSQNQRMTRSKLRKAPSVAAELQVDEAPSSKKASTAKNKMGAPSASQGKTPVRVKSPARIRVNNRTNSPTKTRVASADRSKLISTDQADSTQKRKQLSDSKVKIPRTSSETSLYSSTSVVRTLTKAASYSRLNKNVSTNMSKHHTISTPDMSKTQSVVKSFLNKGSSSRTSPQHTPSFGRAVYSFIKRATPQKIPSKEEEAAKMEQRLREKQELEKQRLEEAEKSRLLQMEAKKRERADKVNRAKELRQAKLEEQRCKQEEIEKRAREKEVKEERQKALKREQKQQEAEEKRKREEERRQKVKAHEAEKQRQADALKAEQKRQADAFARKKECEEAERLKRENEKQNLAAEKARVLNKIGESKLNKAQFNSQKNSAAKSSKTNIYEAISNKTTALSEERTALLAATPGVLNSTFTKDDYEADYVDVNVLTADDEFEDPKFAKCVQPSWAQGTQFNLAIVNQFSDLKAGHYRAVSILGEFTNYTPDLTKIFRVHKPSFFKRTSSAEWDSPPLTKEAK